MKKRLITGFTLIELLITIGISLIIVTSVVSTTIILRREFAGGSDRLETIQNARITADRLTRDLRQASLLVTTLPDKTLSLAGAIEIEFQNGHDADTINYIKYFLQGANLVRQTHHYSFSSDPDTWVAWDTTDSMNNPADLVVDSSSIVGNYIDQLELWSNGSSLISFEVTSTKDNQSSHIRSQVFGRNMR